MIMNMKMKRMRVLCAAALAAMGAWADGARFLTKEELLRHQPFGGEYAKLWSKEFNDEIDARIEKFRKRDYVMRGFRPGETVEVVQVIPAPRGLLPDAEADEAQARPGRHGAFPRIQGEVRGALC